MLAKPNWTIFPTVQIYMREKSSKYKWKEFMLEDFNWNLYKLLQSTTGEKERLGDGKTQWSIKQSWKYIFFFKKILSLKMGESQLQSFGGWNICGEKILNTTLR